MKHDKVENLFDFLPKSKIKAGDGQEVGIYPFYTSSENQSKFIDQYLYEPGCLVFGTGGKASLHFTTSRFATTTDCITIRPKHTDKIDAQYVYQYLKGNMHILESGFKGAGLKHISKSYISKINIPHPEEIHDQTRIAHVLSKVEGLIAQRKQHLQQLDGLLKSVFLEMFGPNAPGYVGWPLTEIKDLAEKHKGAMRTGPFGSNLLHSEFSTEGDVAVLGIDNAVQNRFVWGERRFITNEKYRELESYRIYPGDVIVTIMGTIGRSAVIPDDIPIAINTKHLAAITLNKKIANPLFVSYSIHSSPFILNQFKSKNRGAIMSGLNLGLIKETKLKRPPIDFQNQFAAIHTKVDETKAWYQSSLTNLENLYGALSQKAYKGELDLSRIALQEQAAPKLHEIELSDSIAIEDQININEYPMSDPMARRSLLQSLFVTYLKEQEDHALSLEGFWQQAHFKTIDLMDEFDNAWNVDDYDLVKSWIFERIHDGSLKQAFDDEANKIQLKVKS